MAANLPVTFGIPLREGDVPIGQGLVVARGGSPLPTQWNPLATWKSGSVMHGALTFLTPDAGNNSGQLEIRLGTPVSGAAVTRAELAATAFDAVVACNIGGTVYSLSAKNLLNGTVTPRRDYTHFAGPIISEFCLGGSLRVNGTGTAHAHLTAWFNIRAYKIGGAVTRAYAVCVLENTGARTETFDVTANVTISIAGSTVYTNNSFVVRADRRYPMRLWWPSDPQTWVRHDRAYLAATKLVPQYSDITIDSSWLATMPQSIAWGNIGELDAAMASGGGKRELAPLDGWTAAYLISGDRRAYNSMRAHNDAYHWLGTTISDVAWHYRDENTGYPIDLQANPSMTAYTWDSSASNPIRHRSKSAGNVTTDLAHTPCSGYVPYLLTAEFDELEQTQFAGIHPWMNWAPGGGTGWPRPWSNGGNVREHSWGFRGVLNATITPDAHPLRSVLDALCKRALDQTLTGIRPFDANGQKGLYLNTSAFTHVIYSPGDTPNPNDTGTRTGVSMWMDDWMTWVLAWAAERGYLDRHSHLLHWKVQSVVKRFVGSNWCWAYTPYALGVRDNDAGEIYADWNTLWSKNYPGVGSCPAQGGQVQSGNDVRGDDYFPQIGPALATAASLDLEKAAEAWTLYNARARPAQDPSWVKERHPQWWIVKRTGSDPAWLAGLAPLTWLQIPSTALALAQNGFTAPGNSNKAFVMSYSGACVKDAGSEVWLAGGGHADYAGNEPYTLRLANDAPAWARRRDPTAAVGSTGIPGPSHYDDGRPSSRHTYWNLHFINARNRMMYVGASSVWGNGNGQHNTVDSFNPLTNDYEAAGTFASLPSGTIAFAQPSCKDGDENVWLQNPNSGALVRWNQATGASTSIGTRSVCNIDTPMAYDPVRNRIVRFGGASFGARFDLNNNAAETGVSFGGAQASKANQSGSVVWCSARGTFLIFRWNENIVYECDPVTFEVITLNVLGTKPPAPINDGVGALYGRWFYAPELRLCGYIRSVNDNIWVFRV